MVFFHFKYRRLFIERCAWEPNRELFDDVRVGRWRLSIELSTEPLLYPPIASKASLFVIDVCGA